jgi:hypothetical protein
VAPRWPWRPVRASHRSAGVADCCDRPLKPAGSLPQRLRAGERSWVVTHGGRADSAVIAPPLCAIVAAVVSVFLDDGSCVLRRGADRGSSRSNCAQQVFFLFRAGCTYCSRVFQPSHRAVIDFTVTHASSCDYPAAPLTWGSVVVARCFC